MRPETKLQHAVVLCLLVVVLVVGLLYSISPGEVDAVLFAARGRLSSAASHAATDVKEAGHNTAVDLHTSVSKPVDRRGSAPSLR